MSRPATDLEQLLGERALVALAEAFGGTRLYVPTADRIGADHPIAQAVGTALAARLADRYAPDVITVPLARDQRARHYKAAGDTAAEIARKLGMGERGVMRLLARLRDRGALTVPPRPPAPLPLFPDA